VLKNTFYSKKKKPSVSIITKTVYYFCHEEFGYLIQSLWEYWALTYNRNIYSALQSSVFHSYELFSSRRGG